MSYLNNLSIMENYKPTIIDCKVSVVNLLGIHLRLSTKLSDPCTSAKAYWSILKNFFNGKKPPLILSLLVNGKICH